jgi:hypothetical protein
VWRRLWNKYGIDAVLAPAAQHTAVAHDRFLIPAYTTLLNCLDVSISEVAIEDSADDYPTVSGMCHPI